MVTFEYSLSSTVPTASGSGIMDLDARWPPPEKQSKFLSIGKITLEGHHPYLCGLCRNDSHSPGVGSGCPFKKFNYTAPKVTAQEPAEGAAHHNDDDDDAASDVSTTGRGPLAPPEEDDKEDEEDDRMEGVANEEAPPANRNVSSRLRNRRLPQKRLPNPSRRRQNRASGA